MKSRILILVAVFMATFGSVSISSADVNVSGAIVGALIGGNLHGYGRHRSVYVGRGYYGYYGRYYRPRVQLNINIGSGYRGYRYGHGGYRTHYRH